MNEVPDPKIEFPNDVIVENRLSGICGTDMSLMQAKIDLRVAPAALSKYDRMYLGHENMAIVKEVGEGVENFSQGDRVTVLKGQDCLLLEIELCDACISGAPYLCKNNSLDSPQNIDTGGGFSEFWKYHEGQLRKIPDGISDELAVLTEPLSVSIRAVLRCLPKAGDKVLIWGAGIIGQLTLVAVKYLVPEADVYMITRHQFQTDLAKKYGATVLHTPSWEQIVDITDGILYKGKLGNKMILGGFDLILDCVGNDTTIDKGLRWTKAQGTVVLVGANFHKMKVDLSPIWYQEVNLIGSLISAEENYDNKKMHTYDLCFDIMRSGVMDVEDFITHKFTLDEYKEAFSAAQNKKKSKAIKVVFDFR
jgi:threonine dehydrogenase-like Zn-dependent dehydrogenase